MNSTPSNPFSTRYVRPGAVEYLFSPSSDDDQLGATASLSQLAESISSVRCTMIRGPHGSGKSTLLASLTPMLEQLFSEVRRVQLHGAVEGVIEGTVKRPVEGASLLARYKHGREMSARVASEQKQLLPGGLLIIDGFEQLSTGSKSRFIRRAPKASQHLLVTSHKNHFGFTTIHQTSLSESQINDLTESLICNLDPTRKQLIRNELQRRSLGPDTNLRELWFDLYDLVQESMKPSAPI